MTTWEHERERLAEVGRIFDLDHQGVEMEIVQDEGVHRHIRFRRPGTSLYSFDLTTWPGYLAISGDVEVFVFSRERDMFGFFGGNRKHIDPGYWAEKVRAGRENLTDYSEGLARQLVLEHFTEIVKGEGVPKGLGSAIRREILSDDDFAFEEGAHRLLREFRYGDLYSAWCTERKCRDSFRHPDHGTVTAWVKRHTQQNPLHLCSVLPVPEFEFSDTWEWKLTDWSHHYLYALHAITWGIGKYRARRRMPPRFWAKHGRGA